MAQQLSEHIFGLLEVLGRLQQVTPNCFVAVIKEILPGCMFEFRDPPHKS